MSSVFTQTAHFSSLSTLGPQAPWSTPAISHRKPLNIENLVANLTAFAEELLHKQLLFVPASSLPPLNLSSDLSTARCDILNNIRQAAAWRLQPNTLRFQPSARFEYIADAERFLDALLVVTLCTTTFHAANIRVQKCVVRDGAVRVHGIVVDGDVAVLIARYLLDVRPLLRDLRVKWAKGEMLFHGWGYERIEAVVRWATRVFAGSEVGWREVRAGLEAVEEAGYEGEDDEYA